jgi:hypothetical protein
MKEIRPSEVNCNLLSYGIRSLVLVCSKRLGKVNQFMDISTELQDYIEWLVAKANYM